MIAEGLVRIVSWFVRKAGAGTVLAFTLLLILMEVLVWVLETSIQGLEDSWLSSVAALGLLAGWWLARSKLRGWQAGLVAAVLGISAVLFHLGRLAGPLEGLFFGLPLMKGQVFRWEGLPDLSLILPPLYELWAGVSIPLTRLYHWSAGMVSGQPAYDPAAIVLFWSLVVWGIAVWQSWAVRRHSQPLLAVIPSGALLAITLNYTRQSTLPLAAFLAATLLLFTLAEFKGLVQRWERTGTDYSEDIRFEMALASLSLVLVLTTAAALTPSISIRQLVELTRRMRAQEAGETGQVAESFGLRPRAWQKPPFGDFYSPGLPRSHLLGSGPELSEQVVLVVQVEGLPASAGSPQIAPLASLYWRGLTYDRYSGRGWVTGSTEVVIYPAGEIIQVSDLPTLRRIQQKVHLYSRAGSEGTQLLYAAGELASADQETQVAWRSHQDIFGILGAEAEYQSVSFVSAASESQLRSSGQDYPQWVRERYLALPESVPARVLGLGRDLTATAPTPYDRALAIESYLRSIPYSLQVPVPPINRDVSDYFLYDLRRGYCDYYATAMVVLARAAGLPSRLVMGYASGQYDPSSITYIVTAADAHSWVEVYFPGYGWVEFEPTGGVSPIVRSTENFPEPASPADQPGETIFNTPAKPAWSTLFVVIAGMFALFLGGYAAWMLYDGWSLKRLTPSGTVAALYRRLYAQGRRLDEEITPACTPHEFAGQLVRQIALLGQAGRIQHRLAPAYEEVQLLAEIYARTIYSPHPIGGEEQERAIQTWKRLHWRLWLARLIVKKQA